MTNPRRVTVIGAGVAGLSTALLLQASGFSVRIVSASSPAKSEEDELYTSPKAGAHWRVSLDSPPNMRDWQRQTLLDLLKLISSDKNKETGLKAIPGLDVWTEKPDEKDLPCWFSEFVTSFRELEASELPPGCVYGVKYDALTVNVPKYLAWLLKQFQKLGGTIDHRKVTSLADAVGDHASTSGPAPEIVVNCTGLGSRNFGSLADSATYPTRGQTILVRAPQVDYTITKLVAGEKYFPYVIPRDDGIVVLGGTYQEGNDDLKPDPATAEAILERCKSICPELVSGPCEILEHKVGLRPTRVGYARVEHEKVTEAGKDYAVFHNYGHGGWGYQGSWGCSRNVLKLLREHLGETTEEDPVENMIGGIW